MFEDSWKISRVRLKEILIIKKSFKKSSLSAPSCPAKARALRLLAKQK